MKDCLPDLSLVMPCFNEAESLRNSVIGLVNRFQQEKIALELILVDNGSTDHTGSVIDGLIEDGLPAIKVSVKVNQGYGNGILRGFEHCRGRLAGFIHADGQIAPDDVLNLYRLASGREERVLVKPRRKFRQDGLVRNIVSAVYNGVMTALFGHLGASDINASPKILSRENLEAMKLVSQDWFLDPEMMIKARALGLRILEVDVEGLPRHEGVSKVRLATVMEFVKNILRYRLGRALIGWHREASNLKTPLRSINHPASQVQEYVSNEQIPDHATLWEDIRIVEQRRHEDSRGFVHKILMASQCQRDCLEGEVYVSAAHPGEAKGNHYHRRMGEWFAVVQGEGALEMCDPNTGERWSIRLESTRPRAIYVPCGLAHAVVNTGQQILVCVAVAEHEYDPQDVFAFPVWPHPKSESSPEKMLLADRGKNLSRIV